MLKDNFHDDSVYDKPLKKKDKTKSENAQYSSKDEQVGSGTDPRSVIKKVIFYYIKIQEK